MEVGTRRSSSAGVPPFAVRLPIREPSQVGDARRIAQTLARERGFGETEVGRLAIVVTEAARNLVAHATAGELVIASLAEDGVAGVEILAVDRGPGMLRVADCLRDGYSTAGTPGTGLGAIARLAAVFDVHSAPGVGTLLLARLWSRSPPQALPLAVGAVCLPKPGESVSGDGWAARHEADRTLLVVSDGLGHGSEAAAASQAAIATLGRTRSSGPAEILEEAHAALRSTRGAAVGVAEIAPREGVLRFAGAGNIGAVVLAPEGARHLVSYNGTVGHQVRKVQAFTYPWSSRALLVMHSDGLTTHWSLDRYPELAARHPALCAGALYRDFARGRDDVTVLVARTEPGQSGSA